MKSIFLKTFLVINLFFIYNCTAQTTSDYITFYNEVVPKLNIIATNKTQFYGQSFSNFNNELLNKSIYIVGIDYDITKETSVKYNIIYLYFNDDICGMTGDIYINFLNGNFTQLNWKFIDTTDIITSSCPYYNSNPFPEPLPENIVLIKQ